MEDEISANLIKKIKEETGKDQKNVLEQKKYLNNSQGINDIDTITDQSQPQITYIDHENIKDVDIKAHKPEVDPKKVIKLDDHDFEKF